jgi:hypothetical protein
LTEFKSSNFEFLSDLDPPLAHRAALAERNCLDDPYSVLGQCTLGFVYRTVRAKMRLTPGPVEFIQLVSRPVIQGIEVVAIELSAIQ